MELLFFGLVAGALYLYHENSVNASGGASGSGITINNNNGAPGSTGGLSNQPNQAPKSPFSVGGGGGGPLGAGGGYSGNPANGLSGNDAWFQAHESAVDTAEEKRQADVGAQQFQNAATQQEINSESSYEQQLDKQSQGVGDQFGPTLENGSFYDYQSPADTTNYGDSLSNYGLDDWSPEL